MHLSGSDPVLAVHDLDRSAAWFVEVLVCEMALRSPDGHRFMLGQRI
jgi:hypothetical protein